jgi:hypothetical protein
LSLLQNDGLYKLFPKRTGKYYAQQLAENETGKDILVGALCSSKGIYIKN